MNEETEQVIVSLVEKPDQRITDVAVKIGLQELLDELGPTLVAYVADVRSRQMPARWATGESAPRAEAAGRLAAAHRAFRIVGMSDGPDVARRWFIGANPRLGCSPAEAIRNGRGDAAIAAAHAFADDTGGA